MADPDNDATKRVGAPGANTVPVALNEQRRTYTFPDKVVTLRDVSELIVRPSGDHRLKTRDGHLHIVPPGWRHIEIVDSTKEWTV